ncbi:MAG: DUF3824 domain-containing protein [Clostridium sp.]
MDYSYNNSTLNNDSESQEKYNDTHSNDLKFKEFEFSYIPYGRMSPPKPGSFLPPEYGPQVNHIPPFFNQGKYPPPFEDQVPNHMGPPPNYIPSKKDKNVQTLTFSPNSPNTKFISSNAISFCLYQYTYIWETNGRSYWTYIFNVDRFSVSGLRWIGYYWVYFGVDIRSIDSFVCYRGDCEECSKTNFLRGEAPDLIMNFKKEYGIKDTRTICSQTLCSLDIPEYKNDLIVETVGFIDDKSVQTQIPCFKYRNNSYKIVLDVSLNDTINEKIRDEIIELAKSSAIYAYNEINAKTRYKDATPLENYENSKKLIKKALAAFEQDFTLKLKALEFSKDIFNEIEYSIKEENHTSNWVVN